MARADFGGTSSDFVFGATSTGLIRLTPATLTFWDAESGGTRHADLILDGDPVSSITVGRDGQIPTFQGPDNITQMWADAGGERVLVLALANIAQIVLDARAEVEGVVDANDTVMTSVAEDTGSDFRGALNAAFVGKDGLLVNVLDHGVIGDGTTDDSTAFIAAAAVALAQSRPLWIPRNLTVKLVTPAIDLRHIDLRFEGAISIAQTSSYGIRIGGSSSNNNLRQAYIRSVTNSTSTPTNPSIRVTGVKNGDISIQNCDYLQLFADANVADSTSCAYSTYKFGRQITKLELFGQNGTAWINENLFIGGDFKTITYAGSYNHNNNRHIKPNLEGTSAIDLQVGSCNFFDGVRGEGGTTASFGSGTWQNRIVSTYTSSRGSRTPSVVVSSDTGIENSVVLQDDVGARRVTVARIDKYSRIFNGSSEFNATTTPVPGIRLLSIRNANSPFLDTGIFPLDYAAAALGYESKVRLNRLVLSASHTVLRPLVYCYDSNMAEMDPRASARIELLSGFGAHATNNYYTPSALQNGVRILVVDPTVKYLKILVQASSSALTYDWIDLAAYVPATSSDAVIDTMRRSIARPLYQTAAPTQGLARLGENIGHATGRFTCVSRVDTTLTVAGASTDTTITVASITGINSGDLIGILLTDGTTHWTTVNGAPAAGVITLAVALPSAAASGNQVSTNRWVSIT